MDKPKDFSNDLAALEEGTQVTDILAALKQAKRMPTTNAAAKLEERPKPAARVPQKESPKLTNDLPKKPLQKSSPGTSEVFKDVTTKLKPETKERLRQAARLQDAYGREPRTEYRIVNQAVEDWLKRHGYSRRCKGEEQAHGEPTADPTEASEEA